jgi:hypothetical protein
MTWQDVLVRGTPTGHALRVPVAAADPAAFVRSLSFDAYGVLFGLRGLISDLDEQLKHPALLALTRKRLEKFRAANDAHHKTLGKLFAPLGVHSISFTEYSQYLRDRRSGHMLVQGYEHLFKDWAWGGEETAALLEVAKRSLGGELGFERVLTLGAGACRLPYDLHRWLKPALSLSVDVNPFPLSCARRVIQGEALELLEFPTVPRDLDSFAVKSTLRCPDPIGDGFEFLCHDVQEWAFAEAQFDLVVTPWFIDAVPMATPRLFALINQALTKNGTWLNVGPIGFNKRMLARYYSREEVLSLVEAAGFEIVTTEFTPLPYFHNPRSGHWRTEHVLAFAARKKNEVVLGEGPDPPAIPDWAGDTTRPVRVSLPAEELKKSFAFCLDLLGRLPQGRSIRDLAKAMASKHGLTEAQAEHVIRGTLLQWLDQRRSNPMK